MKKNKITTILLSFVISAVFFAACAKEEKKDEGTIQPAKRVFYIANEGAFGYGNGSLSLFYPDDKTLTNNAFKQANNKSLGDVVQSLCKMGDKLYIVVNASGKVVVADGHSIKLQATMENLPLPRYLIEGAGGTAFLSCWGNGGKVYKISQRDLIIIDSASCGSGPEHMFVSGGKLFVCNGGGFSYDSTITVVDTTTTAVIKTIVTPVNPTEITEDKNGFLWVICSGRVIYDNNWQPVGEDKGALVKINPSSLKIKKTVELPAGSHPSHISCSPDKKTIYYGAGYGTRGIFSMDADEEKPNTSALIDGSYYGFNVGSDGNIYCLEALSFTSSGRLKIFSKDGKKLFEGKTGIGPNGIVF